MNDEKRYIGTYISLIIPAGIVAGAILVAIFSDEGPAVYIPFGVLGFLTFTVSLILSVNGLFKGSRLLKRHLRLWYGCLFALILTMILYEGLFIVSGLVEAFITAPFVAILLILPVIWIWKALRS